jgi:hypothetical protein
MEGHVAVLEPPSAEVAPSSFFHVYSERMTAIGSSRDDFVTTYSLAIPVQPTRCPG